MLEGIIGRLVGEKELTGSLGELTPFYEVSGLRARQVLLVGLVPRPVRRRGGIFGRLRACKAAGGQAPRERGNGPAAVG